MSRRAPKRRTPFLALPRASCRCGAEDLLVVDGDRFPEHCLGDLPAWMEEPCPMSGKPIQRRKPKPKKAGWWSKYSRSKA